MKIKAEPDWIIEFKPKETKRFQKILAYYVKYWKVKDSIGNEERHREERTFFCNEDGCLIYSKKGKHI